MLSHTLHLHQVGVKHSWPHHAVMQGSKGTVIVQLVTRMYMRPLCVSALASMHCPTYAFMVC